MLWVVVTQGRRMRKCAFALVASWQGSSMARGTSINYSVRSSTPPLAWMMMRWVVRDWRRTVVTGFHVFSAASVVAGASHMHPPTRCDVNGMSPSITRT